MTCCIHAVWDALEFVAHKLILSKCCPFTACQWLLCDTLYSSSMLFPMNCCSEQIQRHFALHHPRTLPWTACCWTGFWHRQCAVPPGLLG